MIVKSMASITIAICLLYIIGTNGALENDTITITQAIYRSLGAGILTALSVLILKIKKMEE